MAKNSFVEELTFKVRPSLFKNIWFVCFYESPLKVMKNAFCFILKAPSVFKIFKFCLDCLVTKKNVGFIRKIRLISKIIKSQYIYIYYPISHKVRQGNQRMKIAVNRI